MSDGGSSASDPIKLAVADLIRDGHAHVDLAHALAGLDASLRGRRPASLPYSVWELLEHMRIAQEDILRYTLDPKWESPSWPDEYWPEPREDVDDASWHDTRTRFENDLEELARWVEDPDTDLSARLPHGGSRTYMRQALVAADHNAYHTAQIVAVRKALGDWPS